MKLYIFGASGSGVTTLGQALGLYLDIPYFDSDNYFWEATVPPFTVKRDPTIRNSMISRELKAVPEWIFGGSALNWGADVFPPFDLVVFLWIPAEIRMQRIKEREHARYGDALVNDAAMQAKHADFLAWAADYDHNTGIANRTLQVHEAWLQQMTVPVLALRGDMSLEERMEQIMAWWRSHHE
ncbi:MAG: hypothetical protein JO154_23535 [Chitinophaga sp.]|uniref:hypothetical protein n=1 Tax=Chitinophaga sp. TaxID=1869181 RepID=UPI0025BF485B|nr:hypothetical protein [Chitinophaga sp.]MBV8255587.1 hypothetical protein [Chitinophaga sp.]